MDSASRRIPGVPRGLLLPDAGHRYGPPYPSPPPLLSPGLPGHAIPYPGRPSSIVLADASAATTASGLYYLSELVEEHTVLAKRLLTRLIYSIMGLQLLLCLVDRFPFWLTVFGILSHFVYLGNMRRFPFVKLTDPLFLASCGMATRFLPSSFVYIRARMPYRQHHAFGPFRGLRSYC